jgi:3-phenylpropionate/trans-cinnamate dioxygenase ferredoxin subunit
MTKAIRKADMKDGEVKTVLVGGHALAIARIGDEFFAVDDLCTHADCSLGTDGYVEGRTLLCGCHGASFDLETGKALTLPAVVDVKTHTITVDDTWVYVEEE